MALHSVSRLAIRTSALSTVIHAPLQTRTSSAAGKRRHSSRRHDQGSDREAGGGGDKGDKWRSGLGKTALGGGGGLAFAAALLAISLAPDPG